MSSPSLPGYENLELIGKGGFSRVYRADQSKLKRKVAIKVLNFGLNDEADRVSFARETELMGRVSTHPNIVTVHDTAFSGQGQPCIVMELYPGGSLADLINEVGRLNTQEALEVGVAIASALEASHRSGVLHCDLKPQNILISEFGQPALGDFGISTFAEERTRTGKDAGAGFTLPYAAPEIVEGESPTVASDVYSLAATLYTSLCGRRPFAYPTGNQSKPTAAEHARRILLEPPRSLVDEGIPPELDELIRRAMSKEPGQRPVSAGAFATECHLVGQALGLGTSAPRIADQGALRTVDAEAVGQGQIDLSVLVRQRHRNDAAAEDGPGHRDADGRSHDPPHDSPHDPSQEVSIDATPGGFGFEPAPREVSASRRRLATVGGAAAVLVVAALLFVATRDRAGDEPVAESTSVAAVNSSASNPILAPTQPRNVLVERSGPQRVTVSWQVPTAELEAGDVSYEVRRQGDDSSNPLTTTDDTVELVGVADNEGVCVTVLAVRANRTSSPTAPACSTPAPAAMQLSPASCVAPCEVTIMMSTSASSSPEQMSIIDRSLDDMSDRGFIFDPIVDRSGTWTFDVDATADVGEYLVVVEFEDNSSQAVLFVLLAG